MKKLLLEFNNRGCDKALRLAHADVNQYNSLINVLKENAPQIEINSDNIASLLQDPESFIFDLVVDTDQLNFNGMPISKKKALDLVEFNTNQLAVINAFRTAGSKLKDGVYEIDGHTTIDRIGPNDLEINNGAFTLTKAYKSDLNEEFSTFTKNDKQIEAHQLVTALLDSVIKLRKLGLGVNADQDSFAEFGIKYYANEPIINNDFISSIR